MEISTILKIATQLPASTAVLMRGPTGIGKSHVAHQIAQMLDLPLIDVRGSTMDEAQVSGIPDFEESKVSKVATFVLPSWYVRACREPVVLLLDELNRAMPAVMQSFFQIILDRELGNNVHGETMRLHEGTRVLAAINMGTEYDVNDMDPALLRRFWVVDVDTSAHDWVAWASRNDHDDVLLEFIRQSPAHFRVDPAHVTPGTVVPTPASWTRLNEALGHMGIRLKECAGSKPALLYPVAQGFVGKEAAISLVDFVSRWKVILRPEDVLDGAVASDKLANLPVAEALSLIEALAEHCRHHKWTATQADRFCDFLEARGKEHLIHGWNAVSKAHNPHNTRLLHGRLNGKVMELMREVRGIAE